MSQAVCSDIFELTTIFPPHDMLLSYAEGAHMRYGPYLMRGITYKLHEFYYKFIRSELTIDNMQGDCNCYIHRITFM